LKIYTTIRAFSSSLDVSNVISKETGPLPSLNSGCGYDSGACDLQLRKSTDDLSSSTRQWTAAHSSDRQTCCIQSWLVDGTRALQSRTVQSVSCRDQLLRLADDLELTPRSGQQHGRLQPVVLLEEMISALRSLTGVNLTVDRRPSTAAASVASPKYISNSRRPCGQ